MTRSTAVNPAHRSGKPAPSDGFSHEPSAADAARELAALDLSQPLTTPAYTGDQSMLRQRAVDLFTFLRELVSLRTTVVRNCESYDHVLWINDVPQDEDCDCIAHRAPKDDEGEDSWMRVRKPAFTDPPELPPELAAWVRPDQWKDSALEAPKPLDSIRVNPDGTPSSAETRGTAKLVRIDEHPEIRMEWDRYVQSKWLSWAAEDRRKRQVMKVYTDLFTLYQQQRELGESYEVIVALGQLRWSPKPGVEVNRHVVAVQTSIEFDSARGVITVVPAAEGAKPRLEEDMLELDERPSPDVLTSLEIEVAQCDDDVWHNEQLHATLKKFAHHLGQGAGNYSDDFAPVDKVTNVPQMRWAPAIIVRHRTEQDLLQVYGRILEDLKKRPEVPPGLIPLIEVGWREAGEEFDQRPISENDEHLMFPLHSNDEQRAIVHQLQRQSGVVVQGPPGTGKSHTIANLVCHLLATGHRVLVTSHAPRALRILKDKIPAAITNMCVVLLGNDRTALSELEGSVQVITQQLNTWNPQAREAAIKELEEQVRTLRGRAAEVDKHLRAFRESDTFKHPELEGGYGGTLQHVAQTLRAQQNKYGWITQYTQGLDLDQLPPEPGLTNEEALALLQGLRAVDAQKRADLKRELPQPAEVLSPEQLEQMINDEQQWRTAFDQAKAAAAGDAPLVPTDLDSELMTLKELLELVEQIIRYNSEMASSHYSWVPRLARDIRSGQYDQWKALLENTTPKINLIREQPEQAYELDIAGLGNMDIAQLHEDLEVIGRHLDGGGRLTSFFRYVGPAAERRYIFDNITIGGARVRTNDTVAQLRAWAAVQYQLKDLQQLWADISAPPLGPVVRRLPIWTAWCGIIESAQLMHTAIVRAKDLFGKLPMVKLPSWHDIDQLQLMHKQLKVVVMHKEHQNRRHTIDELAERQSKKGTQAASHALVNKLADTIRRRDVQGYTAVYAQLKDLWAEREKWAHSDVLLKKLAERLPKVAQALSDDPTDNVWEARCGCMREMWLWLRADRWLKKQLDPRHFEYLQGERKSLQDHIQGTMVKLTAEKSWYHCMSRMTPAEETYLKAWMQAIRNIGAGTGKRATRFRKVARQTLERCRSAIPAWIMPIHRVAETVVPGEDRFDVVIVDEASQSGAEALFLHYIAKKIIIVGDDKQIAPYNVGINRDDVELLRSRHIPDLPLSDYYDLDHSFFDQAFLRFGNRIRLIEHFRCMPEIIQFSNELCYGSEPLLPLRQYGDGRMEPVVIAKHVNGHMEGASPNVANKIEAEAIVKQIAKCVSDPAYRDKTFGVISLLGEKQAEYIESKLLAAIGPEEMERRRLICGDAYSFQGDERHVMFISLVVAADEGRRLATLTQAADERRFNVAASRARDQMWLFHSVNPEDLSSKCLRRRLLDYCMHPHVPQEAGEEISIQDLEAAASTADRARAPAPPPFESWLEVDVYLQIRRRGYRVLPQHNFAGYKIDLVVTGSHGRLAVECNGEDWHGQEHYDSDMTRQRQLERCGWRFWRIRGGVFYRNPEQALQPLWDLLDKQGIKSHAPVDPAGLMPATPATLADEESSSSATEEEDVEIEVNDEEEDEIAPVKKTPTRTRKPAAKKPLRRASDSSKDKPKNRKVA